MNFEHIWKRIGRLRAKLEEQKVDAMMVMDMERLGWENVYYLSGFRGSSAVIFVTSDRSVLITDSRYLTQASQQTPFEIIAQGRRSMMEAIVDVVKDLGISSVGFEGDKVPYFAYRQLERIPVCWRDLTGLLSDLRRTKDQWEIERIKRAADVASDAYLKLLTQIKAGMSELEVSKLLEYDIACLGGEGGWSDHNFIVASGVRNAMPHGAPTDKRLRRGEWVTVDFGALYEGYVSDITRNFSLGEIGDTEFHHIHEVLVEAHRSAASELKPGCSGRDIDGISRKVIGDAGYGEYFGHSLGHGFGLDIHEGPHLSPLSSDILMVGDIVTVEPGIYIPGRGGLRVEDDYLIVENGAVRLTERLPQDFAVV